MVDDRKTVLFLCTGNSARSLMAEAILRKLGGDRFHVQSAGLKPAGVNPLTLQVLENAGYDTTGLASKSVQKFLGKITVHHAIFVCEAAQQHCPRIFPFALQEHAWPFEDPAACQGTEAERLAVFRAVRDQIETKVRRWLDSQD